MAGKKEVKNTITSSFFWKLLELTGSQGLQFVVAIILARLMSPDEYGTIAMITVFITIANVVVQSGFATALIQKKEIIDIDYSSVFVISMLLSAAMYIALFIAAPYIALYYDMQVVGLLLRVVGIVLFPGAVISIQTAYISRNMEFKKLFLSTMVAVVISGVVSIYMAYVGFGVWAMAALQIVYYIALMLTLLVVVKWKPSFSYSRDRLKMLFSFGWKMLVSGLIDTIWTNLYSLVIGKKFSSRELGGYNRAEQFPKLIASNLSSAIQSVMLPVFSKSQDYIDNLRAMAKQSIKLSAFAVFPMMAGLVAISKPLVYVLLTDKWAFCIPYLRILCIGYALWPVHITNLQIMNSLGRSDMFLKAEIIKKLIGIVILIYSIKYGIAIMLILKTADEFICSIVNGLPNKRLIGYGILEQYKDMLRPAVCAVIMGICVYTISFAGLSDAFTLVLQIAVGVVVYAVVSAAFNREEILYIIEICRSFRN